MKKKRRYLKDLIPVDINELVLTTGYFEVEIGGVLPIKLRRFFRLVVDEVNASLEDPISSNQMKAMKLRKVKKIVMRMAQ